MSSGPTNQERTVNARGLSANVTEDPTTVKRTLYLTCISPNRDIIIDTTAGKEMIAGASEVFPGHIDTGFKMLSDIAGVPTSKTYVEEYELATDGTLMQIFGSFKKNMDDLSYSQSQIIEFCKKNKELLKTDGGSTFFLFKNGEEYFVTRVERNYSVGSFAHLRPISDQTVLRAERKDHFIVPKL